MEIKKFIIKGKITGRLKMKLKKLSHILYLISPILLYFVSTVIAKVTPNTPIPSNAILIYNSKEYICSSYYAGAPYYNAADLCENDWPVAWPDISQYITAAHRAQGFIDILLTIDMTFKVITSTTVTPTVNIRVDSDNRGNYDLMANADGGLYDNIDPDTKGYSEESMITPSTMKTGEYITLRFAVPPEINYYYKVFLGQKNIDPYQSSTSYSDFYQVKIYTLPLSIGPYACPDIKVARRYLSEYDSTARAFKIPELYRYVTVNKPVTFDASRSVDTSGATITKYEWDFNNDGIYDAEGISPTYIYKVIGTYTVILRVTNSDGQISISNGSNRSSVSSAPLPLTVIVVFAPAEDKLYQNGPNPFIPSKNSKTIINYDIITNEHVTLNIYTVSGELVRRLIDEPKSAGLWSVEWDGNNDAGENVASGIYIYHIKAGSFNDTKKMAVVR